MKIFPVLKTADSVTLNVFPHKTDGLVLGYKDSRLGMPNKILEMGLLPDTQFRILYQAPFHGPLYIEFGSEKSRIALREEEAAFIIVEKTK